MTFIETRIKDLHAHFPKLHAPQDLDAFWTDVLAETREKPLSGTRQAMATPLQGVAAYDVVYQGIDGTSIHGLYLVPEFMGKERYPCVVLYHGYTGSRGMPEHFAHYLLSGLAVFSIDIRGQGGATGDLAPLEGGKTRGWITRGITDPHKSYYKSYITDAIRAVDWVLEQPEIDPARVGVAGGSQGGGLALIVSAVGCRHSFAVADIPNLCYLDWAVFNTTGSLTEVADYIGRYPEQMEAALDTLSYFDNAVLADRIRIPVLVSVGMKDTVCPPEAVFAAYNRIESEKQIEIFPSHGHATGPKHVRTVLEFIRKQVSM